MVWRYVSSITLINNQEQWRDSVDVEVSDRALREIYLPAFKAAVQEGGAWSLMGSYNLLRGEHCCHNNLLLNKILKEEWGFDGAVVSDWGGIHDTRAGGSERRGHRDGHQQAL